MMSLGVYEVLNIGSSVFGFAAILVGILLWRKQGLIEELEGKILRLESEGSEKDNRIDKLIAFCKTVSTAKSETRKVIIVGPRACGKTSIVSLWCKVEKLMNSISPTIGFQTYDYKFG